MEPTNPNNSNNDAAIKDLQAEGIDFVAGSSTSEENEFTSSQNGEEQINTKPRMEIAGGYEGEMRSTSVPVDVEKAIEKGEEKDAEKTIAHIVPVQVPRNTPQKNYSIPDTSKNIQDSPLGIQNDPSIKPLRTFKTDAEEAVRYQNVSAVDIALAEHKKKETNIVYEAEKKSHAGVFVVVFFVIIVVLGAGWYFWFGATAQQPTEVVSQTKISTIIEYDKIAAIKLDGDSDPLTLIAAKLSTANASLGNIYALIPTTGTSTQAAATVGDVFAKTHIPNRLSRSLAATYMIGTYIYDKNSPFVILKNTFFQNAFSGMLDWEKDMYDDLLPFIQVAYPNETSLTNPTSFDDAVISNIDTRLLKNQNGEIVLVYAFVDPSTIVIATTQNSLKYVLDKILAVQSVQ